jgi:circadian clock protein KaiC
LQILNGEGLRVYRRVQALNVAARDAAATYDPSERIPTGIPGLDEIVNGGYFVGSTTVVAGISGVGKSVMGIQYIAEGVRRGERCIMLSLDERVPQIIRNARSIGVDLQQEIDRGLVRLEYDSPQEIEVDVHFDQIERLVKEFKPTRVVIDSLSTYASTLGTQGRIFRDFFSAVTVLMKEEKVTTVYNHENPEMLGMATMMGQFAMSSLVDNIVLLNWAEIGDTFRLGMTIAKMRANPVNRVTHECEILNGKGMRVLTRELRLSAQKPFSSYAGLVSRAPERRSIEATYAEPNPGSSEENVE